jgi:hypothetical protein
MIAAVVDFPIWGLLCDATSFVGAWRLGGHVEDDWQVAKKDTLAKSLRV